MSYKKKCSEMSEHEIKSCVERKKFEDVLFDGDCELPKVYAETTFSSCEFEGVTTCGRDLSSVLFDDCMFKNCKLYSCDFTCSVFTDCRFKLCALARSNFTGAVFKRAYFIDNTWWLSTLDQALVGYEYASVAECEFFAAYAALEAARNKTDVAYDAAKERVGR